jgi:hypothetical protein
VREGKRYEMKVGNNAFWVIFEIFGGWSEDAEGVNAVAEERKAEGGGGGSW